MKLRNIIIRYGVLFCGLALWSHLLYKNYDPNRHFTGSQLWLDVFIGLWNISPNITYWMISSKHQSVPLAKPLITAPAVCLSGFQLYSYQSILSSHSSTAALAFIFLPAWEFAVLGIGYLIGYIFFKGYL